MKNRLENFLSSKNLAGAAVAGAIVAAVLAAIQAVWPAAWLAQALVVALLVVAGLGAGAWHQIRTERGRLVKQADIAQQNLTAQSRRLLAFKELAAAGGQSLDLNQVLELGLDKAIQVLDLDAAEIQLLDDDDRTLVLRASYGLPEGFHLVEGEMKIGDCLCGLAVLKGEPVLVADLEQDQRVTREACQHFGYRSVACVPLNVKGKAIGVLAVHVRETRHFKLQESELLIAIANQLATAIDNARLYADMESRVKQLSQELQYMAVIEERERLGREMHDGLAQTLGLLHMQAAQIKLLLAEGQVEAAQRELVEMTTAIDAGYDEVREAISSLRLTAPKGERFVDWLDEYVSEFGLRHDLVTQLEVSASDKPLVLPPEQEVQLTRIVQESLTNVRKHAEASRIRVRLYKNGGSLTLAVEDDGRGFDVARAMVRRGSYGLSTMQERAEALGGSLRVRSLPTRGTTVTVEFDQVGTDEPTLDLQKERVEGVLEE